ncbi:MAG: HAD family hydrolase [Clostridia bacterium]|nr:HAD family hydrolase [Clostridia bacterium]
MSITLSEKKGFICDMDGVIYHGNRILDGAKDFCKWLMDNDKKFIFLTNSSERSPMELRQKLLRMGLDISEEHFYTSALATANFLKSQCPNGGTAYVIGEPGLSMALYNAGFTMNNVNPDYVVVGETRALNYEMIERATLLVQRGAKLIGTNPDLTGPAEVGMIPATRSLIAPIEMASGKSAYFLGKPNPLMMRIGLKMLGVKNEDACIVGDRMDTDIIAGVESEIDTVLVLSGCTSREDILRYPYRPSIVLNGVGDIPNS